MNRENQRKAYIHRYTRDKIKEKSKKILHDAGQCSMSVP
jgi:hypothetical protein